MMRLQFGLWWRADQVVQCPEMRFILMKALKPMFLKLSGSQGLPFWKHKEGAGSASGNREYNQIAIAGI